MRAKYVFQVLGYLFLAMILVVVIQYMAAGAGWLSKPADLMNANRVQEIYTGYIDDYNALLSQKAQIDALDYRIANIEKKNEGYKDMGQWSVQDRADWDNLSESRLSMVTSFNRNCGQYNADWQNWYKSVAVELQQLEYEIPTECRLIGAE